MKLMNGQVVGSEQGNQLVQIWTKDPENGPYYRIFLQGDGKWTFIGDDEFQSEEPVVIGEERINLYEQPITLAEAEDRLSPIDFKELA